MDEIKTKQFDYTEYVKMWETLEMYKSRNGRYPNFIDWGGIRILKDEYTRAGKSVVKFRTMNRRNPEMVEMKGTIPVKGE